MDCKDLHFEILNLVLKVIHNSWYYCFCNKYSGCEDRFGTKEYWAICRVAVDFNDIERTCDFAQFKFDEPLKVGDRLKPYVKEAEDCSNDDIKQLFDKSDEFCSHRDSYTGYRHEYPLSEWIKSLTETKKKEWVKKIILNHVINLFFVLAK